MTGRSFLLLAAALAAGCGGPPAPVKQAPPAVDAKITITPLPIAEFKDRTELALFNGAKRLKIGDSATDHESFFPKKAKAFELREIPPGAPIEYRASGWETEGETFVVLSFQGRVAFAAHILDAVGRDSVDEVLTTYRREYPQWPVDPMPGANAEYWFLGEATHRVMVCAVRKAEDKYLLTVAVGESGIMDALRMSEHFAAQDLVRAKEVIDAVAAQSKEAAAN